MTEYQVYSLNKSTQNEGEKNKLSLKRTIAITGKLKGNKKQQQQNKQKKKEKQTIKETFDVAWKL